ncbi:MAG TPA: CCA tRNA nucleotidyltransferase [Xanthobacteraceae bacterium]|nr:CCA tRNA nucleotidyltransferase [Xanthobacteraceae bacterium]
MTSSLPRSLAQAPWLRHGPLPRLLKVLDAEGEEARVIGGAVRNALLSETPQEFDIATTAVPETVMSRAAKAGFKSIPTGVEHGTVTVVVDGAPFEVTTLRRDVETFGRKAKVRFGRDWKADAERRDFTINALSVSREGELHDYVGGLADIAARRVRFIGEPRQRIREDYLRILRFFRFHAAYGEGAPDPAGLAAAIAEREGLAQLSRERVRMEWMKLLVAPGAVPTLEVMADAGFVSSLLASVPQVIQTGRLVGLEANLGLAPDPIRRLAVLAVQVTEDAERLLQRLRLSNVEYERLRSMADRWWRIAPDLSEKAARALLYALGPDRFLDRVLYAWARCGAAVDAPAWRTFADLPTRWTAPRFPLRAADFLRRGLVPGPGLGRALARAEEAWIAADFPEERREIEGIADAAAAAP